MGALMFSIAVCGLVVDGENDRIMHMDPVSVPVRRDEGNLAASCEFALNPLKVDTWFAI